MKKNIFIISAVIILLNVKAQSQVILPFYKNLIDQCGWKTDNGQKCFVSLQASVQFQNMTGFPRTGSTPMWFSDINFWPLPIYPANGDVLDINAIKTITASNAGNPKRDAPFTLYPTRKGIKSNFSNNLQIDELLLHVTKPLIMIGYGVNTSKVHEFTNLLFSADGKTVSSSISSGYYAPSNIIITFSFIKSNCKPEVSSVIIPSISSNGPTTFNTGGNVTLRSNATSLNQWYKDGVSINGETSQTLIVTQTGDYKIKTLQNGYSSNFSNTIHVTVNSVQPSQVQNRTENVSGLDYKIYLQEPTNSNNRKGIIVLADGNDENHVSIGSMNSGLLNTLSQKLAEAGYISAIVAYRAEPALASDWSNWGSNCEMLATDLNNVANGIISKYGSTRANIIYGGLSYGSYALLTSNGNPNSIILNGTKGVLATCGATGSWQASNFKIPIYNLACNNGSGKGWESDATNFEGADLINAITNATIKAQSSYFIDNSCNSHCGGDVNNWVNLLVAKVKAWIP